MTIQPVSDADGCVDTHLTPLPPGTIAPDFTLRQAPSLTLSLHRLAGWPVVLAFYPSASDPVSREQLTLYQEFLPQFEDLHGQVVGISADHAWCQEVLAEDSGISFPLLADTPPQGKVSSLYGVYREHKDTTGRALFVVDALGIIRFGQTYHDLLNPGVHDLLTVLEELSAGGLRG